MKKTKKLILVILVFSLLVISGCVGTIEIEDFRCDYGTIVSSYQMEKCIELYSEWYTLKLLEEGNITEIK